MNKIEVMAFPASYGDSFFIKVNYESKEYNVLIDCGFKDTYIKYIKKELQEIKELDLLVLTHLDDDHINGAIHLLKDKKLKDQLKIKKIWFNDLYKIFKGKYRYLNDIEDDSDVLDNEFFDENISYERAKLLCQHIIGEGYEDIWNREEGVIQCEENLYKELYPIDDKIKFILLSPHRNRVDKLIESWLEYYDLDIENMDFNIEEINSFYHYVSNHENISQIFEEDCSYELIDLEEMSKYDSNVESAVNDSSIAFFIEIDDKRMLFLGDSNPKNIEASLSSYIKENNLEKINFDLVKISHHGSKNNTTNDLFNLLQSKKYLITTNGNKFSHPDVECISKIITKQKEYKELIFNYNIRDIEKILDEEQLKEQYKYGIKMPKIDDEIKATLIEI
ncbi:MBL fold metallo-hydrolase [Terrisporobacter petrolearius]|uniref:MBL fold metallo-hydrolase n=1 Tax=Terrisporobacter petrolearius TaxID=1460447 RepID=UPI0031CC75E5